MTNLDELDFNEMTFGRFNPSFQNVGRFTPPNINTKSPKQSKSKREIQLENRLKNNPELTDFTLTAEEKKKLIPIPKKTNKNKKGGKRKTKSKVSSKHWKNKRNRKKRTRRRKRGGDDDANDDANDHTNDCPICMEPIVDVNEKITHECGNAFHRECFKQNCLAELTKGDFSTRDEENEVFQCPMCRGNTKSDCLNNPEVRAKYEELHEGLHLNRNVIGDTDDILQFQNIIHILEDKLANTIQQSENGIINDESLELFLDELYSYIFNYNELPYNDDLSNADLGYMLEVFERQLTAAVRGRYRLVEWRIIGFTTKIRDVLYAFEEHEEHDDEFMGGRNKSKKRGKRKTRSNRGGDNSKRKLNGNDEEFLKKKKEKMANSINMARLFGYRNSPEKDRRNMIPSYLYKEPDPDGVKELRSRFDRDMDIEGEYHEMNQGGLTFGGKKSKKNKKTKRIRKKGGGRKDEYGKRTTKNTKKKDNQGRNLGSSKGTRVKLANIQKATHKKENNKNKIK